MWLIWDVQPKRNIAMPWPVGNFQKTNKHKIITRNKTYFVVIQSLGKVMEVFGNPAARELNIIGMYMLCTHRIQVYFTYTRTEYLLRRPTPCEVFFLFFFHVRIIISHSNNNDHTVLRDEDWERVAIHIIIYAQHNPAPGAPLIWFEPRTGEQCKHARPPPSSGALLINGWLKFDP